MIEVPIKELKKSKVCFLKETLEKGFHVGESTCTQYSITGEPYVTLTSTGIVKEGERIGGIFTNEEIAIKFFVREFIEYAESTKGTYIYWRKEPTLYKIVYEEISLATDRVEPIEYYTIRCRVLISQKYIVDYRGIMEKEKLTYEHGIDWGKTPKRYA
jgi:hypothetical protein